MKVYVTCDPIIFSSLLVKYFPRPEEEQLFLSDIKDPAVTVLS
jgi:hypothetical protein